MRKWYFKPSFLLKLILRKAADGADPVLGQVFEAGAGLDAVVRVAKLGIVFIAAGADVFIHVVLLKKQVRRPPAVDSGGAHR